MNQSPLPSFPIEIKQGATFDLPVQYTDADGIPIDLTNYRARMVARQTPESLGLPLFDLTTENGGISIDLLTSVVRVTVAASVTAFYDPYWTGWYDLFLIDLSGYVIPLLSGKASVVPSTINSYSSSSSSSSYSSSSYSSSSSST